MTGIEYNPDFDDIIVKAILSQIHRISDSINGYIQSPEGAPVDTGALREASYSEVDDSNAFIQVGVDPSLVNPKSGSRVGEYAKFVLLGTSRQDANPFLERAVEAALQEQRARR